MAAKHITAQSSSEPPIASFGWWADKAVPLTQGVRHVTSEKPAAPAASRADAMELRTWCCEARDRADIGGDIRWDVILEQAALLDCGLRSRATPIAQAPAKASAGKADKPGEDEESTSAGSGSCSDGAIEPSSASESEADAAWALGRMPQCGPARRYGAAALLQVLTFMHTAGNLRERPKGLPTSKPEQVLRAAGAAMPPGLQLEEADSNACAEPMQCAMVAPPPGLPAPPAKPAAAPRAALAAAPWRRPKASKAASAEDASS